MKITDLPVITSKDNHKLKLARAVKEGREKELIFVEGIRLASELLRSPLVLEMVLVSDDAANKTEPLIHELLRKGEPELHVIASRVFKSAADTDSSQGIIVLAQRPATGSLDDVFAKARTVLFLNKIANPSNLGAIVRTAEASGAGGVFVSPGSADPFSPKALRASMGSAFRVPIHPNVTLEQVSQLASKKGIRTLAADVNAERPYTDVEWRRPAMLVLGSEAHGLEPSDLAFVDETVCVPMENGVESLNLAVSAGILLYESKRQRESGLED